LTEEDRASFAGAGLRLGLLLLLEVTGVSDADKLRSDTDSFVKARGSSFLLDGLLTAPIISELGLTAFEISELGSDTVDAVDAIRAVEVGAVVFLDLLRLAILFDFAGVIVAIAVCGRAGA